MSLLVAAAILSIGQAAAAVDSVRVLAARADDSALTAYVAENPDEAREAIRRYLVGVHGSSTPGAAALDLALAHRVAASFAIAWRDSLLLRRVRQFAGYHAEQRTRWIRADSLLREGARAAYRDGPGAALELWHEGLALLAALNDSAGVAAALVSIGAGHYLAGALDSAAVYLERGRRLADRVGDHRVAGNAVVTLGAVVRARGELRRASEQYRRALDIHERIGNARGMAADYNNLGLIAEELGELAEARRAYEAALALNRRHAYQSPAADNLLNLGNLAARVSDYREASGHYTEALTTYRELGETANVALVLYNLGMLETARGSYRGALTHLDESVQLFIEAGYADDAAESLRATAYARAALGDLDAATRALDSASAITAGSREPRNAARLALARADLSLRFNQMANAEREYAAAARGFRDAGDDIGLADAQQGRGILDLIRQDYDGAVQALRQAQRTQDAAPARRSAAWSGLYLGLAERERGDTAAARAHLGKSRDTFRALEDRASEATALAMLGDLHRESGLTFAAESLYREGLERLGETEAPDAAWRLRAGLADAKAARGALSEAVTEYRRAVSEIERVSVRVAIEERRAAFRSDKWEVYATLALAEHELGRTEPSFAMSERMRARQMLDLLDRGRIASARTPPALVEREQDLRRRIAQLTATLGAPAPLGEARRGPEVTSRELLVVREALVRAQDQYADLLLEIRQASPAYERLVAGSVAPLDRVQARVGGDEALVEYLLTDTASVAFVVTHDTIAAVSLGAQRASIANLVDFARGALQRVHDEPADLWRAPLRRLFLQLVAPIEATGVLSGKRRLVIVPHVELHYLPFEALVRSEGTPEFLVDRYVVEYAPSASVWVELANRRAGRAPTGVLALAPRSDVLPASRDEVLALPDLYGPGATIMTDRDATEGAFRRAAATHGILHLATYGILNKHNPLFSFVELRPDHEHDGRLEVHEVFGLELSASLVVLSACETALGSGALADVPPGDDWIGLVRAFLYAGAEHVVASLWAVEDVATAAFMARFHRELRNGADPVRALALTKQALARNSRTAHPFYWAGFVVVGGAR